MKTLNGYSKERFTNDYVLLAGYGTKSLSDFLLKTGGTLTGALTIPSLTVTGAASFSQAINGNILGNASTASRLLNSRTITIGSKSNTFDGSADISFTLALIGAFASSSFTLANIKSTLGISDWALAASKPSYTLDDVTDGTTRKLSNYLPLTGGTLERTTSSHSPLTIKSHGTLNSSEVDWASIEFERRTGGRLGYIGIKSDIGPYYYDTTYRTIIHSGNISSQSVESADKLSAQRTISLTGAVTGSGTFDGSEDLSINTSANNISAATITVNAPATTDDSLYNIVFHSGNTLYTSPAKVGRKTGKITCGNISCGSLTASSTISLANNTSLGFKDTTDTYRNCLTLNTSNGFAIGYGTSGAGYNTYLDGKNIYFRTNTNHTTALTLSSGQTATFAGKVELKSDQYTDNGTTCGLDAKNSNIVGINALYFADYCNSATEGINFKRSSGTHVDTLYCQDGKLFFMPDRLLGSSTGEVIQLNATNDNGKPLNQLLPRATPGNIVEQTADNTYTGIVPAYLFSFMQGKPIFNNFPNNVKYYLNLNHTGSHAGNLWYYDHNNNIYGNLSKYARFQGYAYYNECDGQHMLDGFHVAHSTEAGHTYVCIFCARRTDTCSYISDSELRFEWLSNAVGTGSNSYWITDSHLSHKWQWYGYVVNCGYTGTFSTTNHFSVRCDSSTLSDYTWGWYDIYISYALVFDITNFNYLGMSRVILADTATIAEESKEKVTTLTGEGDKSVTSFGTIIGIPGTGQYMNLKVNIAATDSDIGRILSVRKPLNSGYVRIYWINTANTYLYYSGESHSHSSSTYREVSDGGYLRYMYLGLDSGNQKWIQI